MRREPISLLPFLTVSEQPLALYPFLAVLVRTSQLCAPGVRSGNCWTETAVQEDAVDPGWPRQIVKQGATLVYYQPQVDEWQGFKTSTTGLPAAA